MILEEQVDLAEVLHIYHLRFSNDALQLKFLSDVLFFIYLRVSVSSLSKSISAEPAEWSERLTPGQSGWLGAAAVGSIPALALSLFLQNQYQVIKCASGFKHLVCTFWFGLNLTNIA